LCLVVPDFMVFVMEERIACSRAPLEDFDLLTQI
jgi:hypothetical protein